MKKSPSSRRGRASREADVLVEFAEGLAQSGSRAEDNFWEARLEKEIEALLKDADEGSLNAALDRLADRESRAYEELADAIEGRVEHAIVKTSDGERDVLLFAAPVLAWSRMPLPTRPIPAGVAKATSKALAEVVFAPNVDLTIANYFFSPDQLPETFCDTAGFRQHLTKSLPDGVMKVDPASLKETAQFLADQRYIIGAVSVPRGEAIFRWQSGDALREQVLKDWLDVSQTVLTPLLPACAFESMLPRAYYVACRDADRSARPFSIRASVAFLATTLSVSPNLLTAVVGGCYNRQLEEYRIGFSVAEEEEIIHGVVWPLLGAEDEMSDVAEDIENTLKESGLQRVTMLRQRLPMEYCEDCGAPLYPNVDGELVHAELPDVVEEQSQHLH
ncbi:MAG: DUF2863 family protein [Burkholderiaceae bacterium]